MLKNEKPAYICFEGLDGSGKSTVFNKVLKTLLGKNVKVSTLSPTHKGDSQDFFEKIFAENKFLNQSRFFRQFLYAHRSNLAVESVNLDADLILGDRSIITSYVCRWSDSNLKNSFLVAKVNFLESKIFAPDHVFYLDVPHEVLQKRLDLRGERDIDETAKRSLEMRRAYEFIYKNPVAIKRLENTKWHIVDGNRPEVEVFQSVWEELTRIIGRTDLMEV